jgi:hypothetical protein
MIRHQTLAQNAGLGLKTHLSNQNKSYLQMVFSTCEKAHSPPQSSSAPDPSHSPIERGQEHGLRWGVWKRLGRGGVYGVRGNGYGDREWGRNTKIKKGCSKWKSDSWSNLTRGLNFSQRGLDG